MANKNTNQSQLYRRRANRIKNYLRKNYIKQKGLVKITGKHEVVINYILKGSRYPRYTEELLTKIEKHFNLS
jgi:hypothetical protein